MTNALLLLLSMTAVSCGGGSVNGLKNQPVNPVTSSPCGLGNTCPSLSFNTALTVNEAATGTVANTLLAATDAEQTPSQLVFTLVSAPANGTLRRQGSALPASSTFTQADIDAGDITYLHAGGENTSDSFTFSVADGAGGSLGSTPYSISINPVNDPPAVATNVGASINEGSTGNSILASILAASDPDNTAAQVLFTISSLPTQGTLRRGGTALGLGDTFTQADIASSIVTYDHAGNGSTADSFAFTLSDGVAGPIGPTTANLTILAVNENPSISNIADQSTNEDTALTGIAFTVDEGGEADEDAQNLTVTVTSSNQFLVPDGNITVNYSADNAADATGGTLDITPTAHLIGTATITVTVTDNGTGNLTAQDTFVLTVNPVNDNPTISNIGDQVTDEGVAVTGIAFTADEGGASDEDSQNLTVAATSSNQALIPDANITVSYTADNAADATGGTISVQPVAGQTGTATITVTVTDNGTGNLIAQDTFLVTASGVNDNPTIADISNQSTNEDTAITGLAFTVDEGGGADEDAQNLTITATSSNQTVVPDAGITVNYTADNAADATGGTLTITPAAHQSGTATITVTVTDNGTGNLTAQDTFTVTVNAVNDNPTIADISNQSTNEDTAITGIAFTVDEGGIADEDSQNLTVTATSSNQTLVPDASITVTYAADNATDATGGTIDVTPASGQTGTTTITVTVTDNGTGNLTAQDTFVLTVSGVNDAPTIADIPNQSTNEDTAITGIAFTVDEGGLADEDSQNLTITATSSNQTLIPDSNITVNYTADNGADATGGTIDITPALHLVGTATITVTVTDNGTGNLTAQDTFVVTVNGVNDNPTIADISNQSTNEDTSLTGIAFTVDEGGASDEDSQNLTVTATSSNQTLVPDASITVTYAADNATDATGGTIDITPAADQAGTTTITVTVTDNGTGNLTAQDTFVLTVSGVNEAPTIANIPNQSTNEDTALTGIAFTVDEGGAADEDSQNLTVTATSSNQFLVPDGNITVNYSADNAADATGGTIDITPTAHLVGTITITVTVTDNGTGNLTAQDTFDLTVNAVNDNPTLADISNQSTNENTAITGIAFTVDEGGASDEDSQNLTVTATSSDQTLVPNASITVNYSADNGADATGGTLDITPAAGQLGTATITVTVTDNGTGNLTAQDTFVLTVSAVNDAPTIADISNQSTNEDTAITGLAFTVDEGGAADEDSQNLTVTATSSNQTLIPDANITVNYTADNGADATGGTLNIAPAAHQSGTATITVTVTDNGTGNLTAQDTFTVTVNAVNDNPTIADISNQSTNEDTALTGIAFTVDEGGIADEDAQNLTVTATSSNQTLVPNASITVNYSADNAADATGGTIDITPASGQTGTATITVTVTDNGTGNLTAQDTFDLTVSGVNDAPTIADISNQSTNEDTALTGIAFTVDEGGTADEDAQNLTVTATSSNQFLVPDGNITVNYSADNAADATGGTIDITPTADLVGPVTITVTVTDNGTGNLTAQDTFVLTVNAVNDNPTIADISNQSTNEDTALTGIAFTVDEGGAADEDNQNLTVTATSSNQTLVPDANITVSYTADNAADATGGTLDITPAAGLSGSATITVTVTDNGTGNLTAQDTFTLTVSGVNDAPTLSDISDPSALTEDGGTGLTGIAFTVDEGGASDEDSQNLTVTATSSNQAVIPNASITVNYSADNAADATGGSIDIAAPPANAHGTATITVTVTDNGTGNLTAQDTFVITVNAVNDNPVLDTNTGITVGDGSLNNVLGFSRLSVSDVDNTAAQITYTVGTAPTHGTLRRNGTALSAGSTFTQADIDSSLFTYSHNDSPTFSDSFTFTVSDGAGGSIGLTTFNITIDQASPSNLTYSTNPAVYTRNVAITSNTPSNSGGAPASYSISPSLPSGLSFSTVTGIISGTPTALSGSTAYTITASNGSGSTQATLTLSVVDPAPANLDYLATNVIYPLDVAITDNIPSWSGGNPTSFSISPSLPAGLSFDTNTGVISGTPTASSSQTSYTVTASNTGGSVQKVLDIGVAFLAPTLSTVFPVGGPSTGGTPVTISGSYFRSGATVTIGGVTCSSVNVVSGTSLTCTTGAHASGLADVVVTNDDAQSGSLTNAFTYSSKVWLGGAAQSANAWNIGGIPASGSGDGMLSGTFGNAVAGGYLYVIDHVSHRVAKYNVTTGAFVGWIGGVNMQPTGGAAGCSSTPSGSATPGWCIGGSSQLGSGNGMFNNPNDVFVDHNGYLYVADVSNHRVQKFNASTGAFIGWIGRIGSAGGTCTAGVGNFTGGWCTGGTAQAGTGDGMFNGARNVFVPPGTDILYVNDRDNHRVHKFVASSGAYVGWIGRLNSTAGASCAAVGSGNFTGGWCTGGTAQSGTTGNGSLNSPRGIAVDSTNSYIYVVETGNIRVSRFDASTGAFAGWIGRLNSTTGASCAAAGSGNFTGGWCTGGTSQGGTGDGMFGGNTRGVSVDDVGGSLYVGDYNNDRISRYDMATGAFTGWIGRIATSPTGGDAGCNGAPAGTYTPGWCTGGTSQAGSGSGHLNGAATPVVGPSRVHLYACDDGNKRVNRYNLATGAYTGSLGAIQNTAPSWIASGVPITGTGDGVMNNPFIAVNDGSSMYVADTSNHRIVKYDLNTGSFVGWIGRINSSPTGGAAGCDGAATGTFTPGWCTGGFAQSGTGDGMLNSPTGLAITAGILYVADTGNHRISSYNASTGTFLGWYGRVSSTSGLGGGTGCSSTGAGSITPAWCTGGTSQTGSTNNGGGSMNGPRGLAISSDGTYLYVADSGNHRVLRLNRTAGSYSAWFGRIGSTAGGCSAGAGNFTNGWCSATNSSSQSGTPGNASGAGLNTPSSVAVDPVNDDIVVADSSNNRVVRYTSSGSYQGWLGLIGGTAGGCTAGAGSFTNGFCAAGNSSSASGTGDGMLNSPRGVTFDPTGAYLYVSDFNNHRINKYNYPAGTFVGWQGNIATSPTGGDTGCNGATVSNDTPGWCTGGTASASNGNGRFSSPLGLSSDANYLYIGDSANYRILRMDH